ncbi:MAG: hypothetical protein C4567_03125 [Deltaproteobacteria bacterium]|nr:MAG: hypothetical protein C4567_03125 [Deltaproteobacteria bacterium]
MANDFSTDPRCKALWKLDGDLTDGHGGNHLTGYGSPAIAFDDVDQQEGSHCGDFEKDNGNYAGIPDAVLDPGFPLKNGDANNSKTTGNPLISLTGKRLGTHKSNYQDNLLA